MNGFDPKLLNDCDSEPLAFSGLIQTHGAVLFLSRESGKFSYGSENLRQFLGESCDDLLGGDGHVWLSEMLPDLTGLPTTAGDRMYLPRILDLGAGELNVLISPTASGWIIEFELSDDDQSANTLDVEVPLLTGPEDMRVIQQTLVDRLAQITGYDRVMLYQFLPDWSGEVLAECVQRSAGTYHSLRFPASDIPAIARGLYAQTPYRYIPLATNEASPIRGLFDASETLDLAWADLRSVSPVHIQYLNNMQVYASFSVSIMVAGKLWGLIASHNDAPGLISMERRLACTQLIENFVARINELRVIQQKLIAQMIGGQIELAPVSAGRHQDLAEKLVNVISQVSKQVDFSACIVDVAGQQASDHEAVSEELGRALVDLFREAEFNHIDAWEKLPDSMPGRNKAWDAGVYGCGCFRVRASAFDNALVTILLLRPEESGEVAWAGNPEKPVELTQEGGAKLSPRESFEKWVEVRRGMSRVWNEDDLFTMNLLRKQLYEALA